MKNYFEDIGVWPRSHGVARAYVVGFVLSLALTLIAYSIAVQQGFSPQDIGISVAILAFLQFGVQVYCFLHLGKEGDSWQRLLMLCWAAVIVGILVSGSLWIMYSLNSRMMPSTAQEEQYMNDQVGF
jgi:cytochrome o ubiquinol oxidase operon protein cyoD